MRLRQTCLGLRPNRRCNPLRTCARLAARLDRGVLTIDRYDLYEVFCFCGTLGGQLRARLRRWLKTTIEHQWALGDIAVRNVHGRLEEATNVVHGDEGRGR